MSSLQQSQSGGSERGIVDCQKCNGTIYVERPSQVAVEFSVPCPKCGHRGMYFKRMMRSELEPTERRRTPRG